jgi:hypothetical protein
MESVYSTDVNFNSTENVFIYAGEICFLSGWSRTVILLMGKSSFSISNQ